MTVKILDGKVAIVTGAGHGAGRAIAEALAAGGARVAVNDINPDRAYRAAAELRQTGGAAIGVMADVANRFQCVHLIETTRNEWGRIDILVNCAAIAPAALPAFVRACAREFAPLGIRAHLLDVAGSPEEAAALVMGIVTNAE